MDETLQKIERDLLQLDYIYEEQNAINIRINKLEGINRFKLDDNFYGDGLITHLNAEQCVDVEQLNNVLIYNVQNGFFKPKNYVAKPTEQKEFKLKEWVAGCIALACSSVFCLIMVIININLIKEDDSSIFRFYRTIFILFTIFSVLTTIGLSVKTYKESNDYNIYLIQLNKYNEFIKNLPIEYKEDINNKCQRYLDMISKFEEERKNKIAKLKDYDDKLESIKKTIIDNTELPVHYALNPTSVSVMLNIIFSKRADTLKEMINIYEQDCKLNIIISEIQRSNKIFVQSMQDNQMAIANYSNILTSEMRSLKEIACSPIRVTGITTTYTY